MTSEYSPPGRGTARVTKKQLKKIQENYQKDQEIAEDFREKEGNERNKDVKKVEEKLNDVF